MLGIKDHIKEFSFGISKSNESTNRLTINELLKDINIDDYYILKGTRNFHFVYIEELKSFKFAKYLFLKKDKYDLDHINKWLNLCKVIRVFFLNKPFPNFDPYKIKIIKL